MIDLLREMKVGQDGVGGPPRVAVVEENGQIIAVRLYLGDDADEENDEEGFVTGFDFDQEELEGSEGE
jgi:hypothetical protein